MSSKKEKARVVIHGIGTAVAATEAIADKILSDI